MSNYSKFNVIYRLQKWMDSVNGQTFLNYAYSWGAAIVILGTLFKLTHLPGANFFLFLGMGTEVFVFFISAFDRPFDKTTEGMELAGSAVGNIQPQNQMQGGTNDVEEFCITDGNDNLESKREELLKAYDLLLHKVNAYTNVMTEATEQTRQITGRMMTANRMSDAIKKALLDELYMQK